MYSGLAFSQGLPNLSQSSGNSIWKRSKLVFLWPSACELYMYIVHLVSLLMHKSKASHMTVVQNAITFNPFTPSHFNKKHIFELANNNQHFLLLLNKQIVTKLSKIHFAVYNMRLVLNQETLKSAKFCFGHVHNYQFMLSLVISVFAGVLATEQN